MKRQWKLATHLIISWKNRYRIISHLEVMFGLHEVPSFGEAKDTYMFAVLDSKLEYGKEWANTLQIVERVSWSTGYSPWSLIGCQLKTLPPVWGSSFLHMVHSVAKETWMTRLLCVLLAPHFTLYLVCSIEWHLQDSLSYLKVIWSGNFLSFGKCLHSNI